MPRRNENTRFDQRKHKQHFEPEPEDAWPVQRAMIATAPGCTCHDLKLWVRLDGRTLRRQHDLECEWI